MGDPAEVKTPEELFKAAEAMKAEKPDYLVEDFGAVQGSLESVVEHAEARDLVGDVHEKAKNEELKIHNREIRDNNNAGDGKPSYMLRGQGAAHESDQAQSKQKEKEKENLHRLLRMLEDHARWLVEQIEAAKEELARVQKDNGILEGALRAHKDGSPLSAAQIALMDKYYKDANGEYNWDRAEQGLAGGRDREEELKIEIEGLESDLEKTNENIQKVNNGENPDLSPEEVEYLRARGAAQGGSNPFNKSDDQLSDNPISAKNIKHPFKVAAGGEEPQMGVSDELTKKVIDAGPSFT